MDRVGARTQERENGLEWKLPEVPCVCIDIGVINNTFVALATNLAQVSYFGHSYYRIDLKPRVVERKTQRHFKK